MATEAFTKQTTLGVSLPEEISFEQFWGGENAPVVAHLQALLADPVDRYCFVWGEPAVGKTHLIKALCYQAAQQGLTQLRIPLERASQFTPAMLQGLENVDVVCIDDIQLIAGQAAWEEALFHYYNRFLPSQSRLVIASELPPNQLALQLPDLRSRLNQGSIYHVKPLADADKLIALQQHARVRGMHCPPAVAEFILSRSGRDMASLMASLDKLDQASLAAKRGLTVPFVKTVLGI